jgi:hypothetical protein
VWKDLLVHLVQQERMDRMEQEALLAQRVQQALKVCVA